MENTVIGKMIAKYEIIDVPMASKENGETKA